MWYSPVMHRLLAAIFVVLALLAPAAHADEPIFETQADDAAAYDETALPTLPPDEYARARVLEVLDQGVRDGGSTELPYQTLKARVLSGPARGQELTVDNGTLFSVSDGQLLRPGETFVLVTTYAGDGTPLYAAGDRYRLPLLGWFVAGFLVLVGAVARRRGLLSFLGLAVSVGMLALYTVPQLAAGAPPLPVTLLTAAVIVLATLYLAHGFTRDTTLAVVSTAGTLVLAGTMAAGAVALAHLTGGGTEDALSLQFGQAGVDLKGLFLAGILVSVIGVLDDITTGQTAVVRELRAANPTLGPAELFRRASLVGREHIASLVNTLALAYAGVSLPLFLVLASNPQPLWLAMNSEFFAEELVRTLVGSAALVLAVPLSTALAAWYGRTDQ